ncbi:MAG: UDP-N-acetylmuramate dehydrogenase [Planctomycetes bacterium]|nr:UDP-N-acetylmuramate dehydrogenase [Planctomycetota bacterium]
MSTVSPDAYADLSPMRLQVPLAEWTTLRIGGPAEYFFQPPKPEQFAELLTRLEMDEVPFRLLGAGANVLAPDGGVLGAVIQSGGLRRMFREENCLRLWPGVTLPQLVRSATELGLSGVEKLIGVPGHIGGALAMNAGSSDWGIWQQVKEVTLWLPGGELVAKTPQQIQPGYRNGNLGEAVVLEVLLEFEVKPKADVKKEQEAYLRKKNVSQPVTLSTAGCAFRNPQGSSAGQLIESVGLKGWQCGGIQVSPLHANFLVNTGGATAADVRLAMAHIQKTVLDQAGVELQTELVIWPEPLPKT